jgi:hypothetical protein
LSAALRAIADPKFCECRTHEEQHWRANRAGAHPAILEFETAFIRKMRAIQVPLFAHNMVRTAAEQTELYVRGVSKAKAGQSPHNFGCAVDIIHGRKAWDMDKKSWSIIGHIGKELAAQRGLKVEWGGDWKFYDPAHWQLESWRELSAAYPFNGAW